jgi:hypothetical protein
MERHVKLWGRRQKKKMRLNLQRREASSHTSSSDIKEIGERKIVPANEPQENLV